MADPANDPTLPHAMGHSDDPSQLGRYPVTGELGAGGMGLVYRVEDRTLERDLAAKVLRADDQASLDKFILEAKITGLLEHPNIVPIHELSTAADGRHFFTMKRVEGEDLDALLDRMANTAEGHSLVGLLQIFLKVCDAIEFAHSRGVIHRDLKPANIMIGQFGEVLVMDWGLAKLLTEAEPHDATCQPRSGPTSDSGQTLDGTILGTPSYMPPEQAEGQIAALDQRSDIYSLGAVLYELLTLEPPYDGDPQSVLMAVRGGQLLSPSERAPSRAIPWELDAVVLRAMARDQEARYASVQALKEDLLAYLDGRTLTAARYSILQRATKWVRRHRAFCGAVAMLLIFALGTLGWLQLRAREQLRKAERDFRERLSQLREQLSERATHAARRPDRLRHANGDLDQQAAHDWYGAHAAVIETLDALASLRAPSPSTLRELDLTGLRAQRVALCQKVCQRATSLTHYNLARSWIGRAGLNPVRHEAALLMIERARHKRVGSSLARARQILLRAREPKQAREGEWFEASLNELVRLRSSDLVRMLLDRAHLDSDAEWERRLTIAALGRIGDSRTKGPDQQDAVEALCSRLLEIDPARQLELAVALAQALGYLRDSRAYQVLHKRRRGTTHFSAFRDRTRIAMQRIPPPAQASQRAPETAQAWLERGMARMDQGDVQGAIDDYSEAIRRNPEFMVAHLNRGNAQLKRGALKAAIADYSVAIRIQPIHSYSWSNRGHARLRQGELKSAMVDFNRALELDPNNLDARLHRGQALIQSGQPAAALKDIDQVLRRQPTHALGHSYRGTALSRLRDFKRAIEAYSTALRLTPTFRDYSNRGLARQSAGDLDGAIADYDEAIKLKLNHITAHFNRANARRVKGDLDRAIKGYTDVLRLAPKHTGALLNRGGCYFKQRRFALALPDLDRCLKLESSNVEALNTRAMIKRELKDLAGAKRDFERAISIAPRYPGPYLGLAGLELLRGNRQAAIALTTRAVRAQPRYVQGWFYRGKLYQRGGQPKLALADFRRTCQLAPTHWQAWAMTGVLLRGMSQPAQARSALRKALRHTPPAYKPAIQRELDKLK